MTVTTSDNRLLRLSEVQARCGLSRSTVYRQMGEGAFPPAAEGRGPRRALA